MNAAAAVFIVSLALLAYTFAGYPLLLAAWARLAPKRVRRAAYEPPVAMIVVVHNGAPFLERKIASFLAQDYPSDKLRLLIVSDGSDDGIEAAAAAHASPRIRLLAFAARRGKAACVNDAIKACPEEILVLTDIRQALHPQAVRQLVANFADDTVGVAGGQLVFERDGMTGYGQGLDAYWRYETRLRRRESRIHSSVGVSGALYALRRACFRPIPPHTLLDDVLIPMNAVLQGYRVVFEETAVAYDRPSPDAGQEKRRKVRTLAGNFQLLAHCPELLLPWRNPVAWQFISHKLLRLVAPAALLAALAANIALAGEGPLWLAMLVLQGAAWGLAALGAVWPAGRRLRPVGLAFAFASLNVFVVLGLVEFLRNPKAHLWGTAPKAAREVRHAG